MPPRPQKSKSRNPETRDSYLFRIDSILPDYSFGIGHARVDIGSYAEYVHTEIKATCLIPKKLSGRTTRFTLMGDRQLASELVEPSYQENKPIGIGTLTMRGQRNEYMGKLPFDALANLSALILANGFQFILLSGTALQRGTSRIDYIGFKSEADPEDY